MIKTNRKNLINKCIKTRYFTISDFSTVGSTHVFDDGISFLLFLSPRCIIGNGFFTVFFRFTFG